MTRQLGDISDVLETHMILRHCPECDAYFRRSAGTWFKAQSDQSKELCCAELLRLPKSFTVVKAKFIQNNPHSVGVKLRLKTQETIRSRRGGSRAVCGRPFVVEFIQVERICESCTGVVSNPDQWVACVQLRQHVSGIFFYLDELIMMNDPSVHRAIRINQVDQGFDFFFLNRSDGVDFVEFISRVTPAKSVSHDNDTPQPQYTFSVEIPPISQNDLICLPPNVVLSLRDFGPIVICTQVTDRIALLDPFTLRHRYLNADQYWEASFKPLRTLRQLVEYTVLDVEIIDQEDINNQGCNAKVRVARVSDDNIFSAKTHLAHSLKPGHRALGYDLYPINDFDFELQRQHEGLLLPEVFLIMRSSIPRKPQVS